MYNNHTRRLYSSNKAIKRILIINIAFFLIANIIVSSLVGSGGDSSTFLRETALSSDIWIALSKPWTFITSMFLHLDFMHILFNMLYFWWFAQILKDSHSSQSVISSYVLGALVGAVFYLIYGGLIDETHVALGASGGVTAIMVAAATINPNKTQNLLFIGPVKIKWIVLAIFILTTVLNIHENTGGKVDHMGGAAFGFVYAYYLKRGINISGWFDRFIERLSRLTRIPRNKTKIEKNAYNTGFRGAIDRRDEVSKSLTIKNILTRKQKEKEVDKLLDKINRVGYTNLSDKEKDRLKELSKDYE